MEKGAQNLGLNNSAASANSGGASYNVQSKNENVASERGTNIATKPPKKAITVFLIISTMLLSLGLVIGGTYALYISIGFSFLRGSALAGLNTSSLYTYPNSGYSNGGGSMVGLIIISIIMLGLGVGMAVIFFKQLPLYRQIKLVAKMPNVKYKEFTREARKGIIATSIIAYIVCIAFCVFAIVVASRQPISASYKWVVLLSFGVVLALAISSMVLMFVKLGQLSKIKKQLKGNDDAEIAEVKVVAIDKPQNEEGGNHQQMADDENGDTQDNYPNLKSQSAESVEVNNLQQLQSELLSQTSALLIASIAQGNGESKVNKDNKTKAVTARQTDEELNKDNSMFETGVFELSDALQKLREIHVSGLIDASEYTQIRQKWINAMLKQPLFDGAAKGKSKKGASSGASPLAKSYAAAGEVALPAGNDTANGSV